MFFYPDQPSSGTHYGRPVMYPSGAQRRPTYTRSPYGYGGYSDVDLYEIQRENERRAMMERRRREQAIREERERQMYAEELKKRKAAYQSRMHEEAMHEERERQLYTEALRKRQAAHQSRVKEQARQKAIRALTHRSMVRKVTKIQQWWRTIAQRQQAERQNAAAVIVTRTVQRFVAFLQARNVLQSLRQINTLRGQMNDTAPADKAPPTVHKERLFYEDTLEKIILKLDNVNSFGNVFIRNQRKRLVVDVNDKLRLLDEALASETEERASESDDHTTSTMEVDTHDGAPMDKQNDVMETEGSTVDDDVMDTVDGDAQEQDETHTDVDECDTSNAQDSTATSGMDVEDSTEDVVCALSTAPADEGVEEDTSVFVNVMPRHPTPHYDNDSDVDSGSEYGSVDADNAYMDVGLY